MLRPLQPGLQRLGLGLEAVHIEERPRHLRKGPCPPVPAPAPFSRLPLTLSVYLGYPHCGVSAPVGGCFGRCGVVAASGGVVSTSADLRARSLSAGWKDKTMSGGAAC